MFTFVNLRSDKMFKSNEGYGADKLRILKELQKRPHSLAELAKLGIRQNIRRSIRRLLQDGEIRAFVKIQKLSKVRPVGILDEEIYFSIAPSDYPQEIHELKKTIENMCNEDMNTASLAYERFVDFCVERGVPGDDAIKLAYDLICGLHPGLKEKVVFGLTYKKDKWSFDSDVGSYDPRKKEWDPPLRNYEYFINL